MNDCEIPTQLLPDRLRSVYLIGLAGVGMAALAGLLKQAKYHVSGSDENAYPPMTDQLKAWGIEILTPFSASNLEPTPDLAIIGKAIHPANPEVHAVRERSIPFCSFPDALSRLFLKDRVSVVVSGTHGKTTTTSLVAHVLNECGREPGFLIGGIPENFGEGCRIGACRPGSPFVIEGDEYATAFFDPRPKFIHYSPTVLLCGNLEYDHGNIYADVHEIVRQFASVMELVPPHGTIIICAESPQLECAHRHARITAPVVTYGNGGDWNVAHFEESREGIVFIPRWKCRGRKQDRVFLPLHGRHNLLNALGAYAVLRRFDISHSDILNGFASFRGVKRRMELRGKVDEVLVVDDFAHHPTAVAATLQAARVRFPGYFIWAIFEPRSFTSCRRTFQKEYAHSLRQADCVVLAPPFRVLAPEDALDVRQLKCDIENFGVPTSMAKSTDEIVAYVSLNVTENTVLICMSSGEFDRVSDRLLATLRTRETGN